MPGRRNRLRDPPNHYFDERIASNHNAPPKQRNSLHVGDDTNTGLALSITPT
jgi:hypothetical protein